MEDTYAATLAARSFRILMAMAAKYDLETKQLDAVNAFMNAKLDRVVYMQMPPGHGTYGNILRINQAMYGLRRSPLLWQRELTKAFESIGFTKIPQEPCAMIKCKVIVFFFVDDIGLIYPKDTEEEVETALKELREHFQLTGGGEINWFLGIRIIRDRPHRKLWLSQVAYIDKICTKFLEEQDIKAVNVPLQNGNLSPYEGEASKATRALYQSIIGSIQYAAVVTRIDIAFAASRLARYNHNPAPEHMEAAKHVLRYLLNTRAYALEYRSDGPNGPLYASDASFADNPDRKSTQGYVMLLFGGAVVWRSSKQATVTTSTTEAELLAISETAREGIFISRLLKSLDQRLDQKPQIQCDNSQTVKLLTEENAVLSTRLRHVDIHNHWLRQEVKQGRVEVEWISTHDMVADGLTKALPRIKIEQFRKQVSLVDIEHILEQQLHQKSQEEAL
jgi:hypothetical protein